MLTGPQHTIAGVRVISVLGTQGATPTGLWRPANPPPSLPTTHDFPVCMSSPPGPEQVYHLQTLTSCIRSRTILYLQSYTQDCLDRAALSPHSYERCCKVSCNVVAVQSKDARTLLVKCMGRNTRIAHQFRGRAWPTETTQHEGPFVQPH
jgi:hypothetical protein